MRIIILLIAAFLAAFTVITLATASPNEECGPTTFPCPPPRQAAPTYVTVGTPSDQVYRAHVWANAAGPSHDGDYLVYLGQDKASSQAQAEQFVVAHPGTRLARLLPPQRNVPRPEPTP